MSTVQLIIADSEKHANLYYATRFLAPDPFVFVQHDGRTLMVMSDLEVDRAYGRLRAITDEERTSRNLMGLGAGLHLQVDDTLSAKVEWGFNVGDDPLSDDSGSTLHFTLQFDF